MRARLSAGDDGTKPRQSDGMSRQSVVDRPQIKGVGCGFLLEALSQDTLEKCFGERWRQFDARLAVTALAAIKLDGGGAAACHRRVAVHQDSEFVVGQPDLHAVHPDGPAVMFTSNPEFLFKIGHSNDKKDF